MAGTENQMVKPTFFTDRKNLHLLSASFKMPITRLLTVLCFFVFAIYINAQSDQSNVRFTQGNFDDSGALSLGIPLSDYSGRGLNLPVSLSYSSDIWKIEHLGKIQMQPPGYSCCITQSVTKAIYAKNSASGWKSSLALPIIEYPKWNAGYDYKGKSYEVGNAAGGCFNYRIREVYIHMPDGSSHTLRKNDQPSNTMNSVDMSGDFYAVDESRIRFTGSGTADTGTIYMPDGTIYNIGSQTSTITDRNGNSMSYNKNSRQWTDTLGRVIANPLPDTPTVGDFAYTLPGLAGVNNGQLNYVFKWRTLENALTPVNGSTPVMRVVASEYLPNPSGTPSASNPPYQESSQYEPLFKSSPIFYTGEGVHVGTLIVGEDKFPVANGGQPFNPVVLTEIVLPDGTSYKFSYDVYGEIDKVTYPTNSYDRYEYTGPAPNPTGEINEEEEDPQPYIQALRSLKSRRLSADENGNDVREWRYTVVKTLDGGGSTTVINPDKTRIVTGLYEPGSKTGVTTGAGGQSIVLIYPFGFKDARVGMPKFKKFYTSSADGTGGELAKQEIYQYEQTTPIQPYSVTCTLGQSNVTKTYYLSRTPRMTRMTEIVFEGGSALAQSSTYAYDLTNEYSTGIDQTLAAVYNYVVVDNVVGQSGDLTQIPLGTLHSYTETTFSADTDYRNSNILGLAISSQTKDSTGTVVSRSEMLYDESAYSTGYKRGMPTTSRTWDSTKGLSTNANAYLTTHATFDSYGNRTIATDAMGNQTTTVYDSTYHAFPVSTTTAAPDPAGTKGATAGFTTSITYDSSTPPLGLPVSTTDANGQTTTMEYNDALLRPTKTTAPNGQQTITEYGAGTSEATRYVKVKIQIDTDKWKEGYIWYDGIGRTYKSQKVDSEGDVFSLTCYDAVGRVQKTSNPFRNISSASCSSNLEWTTPAYDALGRVISTTLPDSSVVQTAYGLSTSGVIGVTKQITDQAGKKRTGITDALGRMIRVIEDPDNSNLATDYVFDTLGNLRKTIQGEQSRYFSYDSLGRLLYAKQPEQEANTNFVFTDPLTNNSQWSVKYEYDDNSNITKTTDARGISVQGTYDKLNRLTRRDYSDATPDVDFYYDGTGLGAVPSYSKGKTTRVTSSVSESRYTSFDNLGRLLTHQQITDGQTYNTAYQYNLTSLIAETYPSGRIVRYNTNTDGELESVTAQKLNNAAKLYLSQIKRSAAGQIESLRLGNGRFENAVYNSRGQVTQIGLGFSETDKSLLRLDYEYGANARNNGALSKQKLFFRGLTSEIIQDYTYDNLNRLKSSTETVNNQVGWKQTFSYDRFGNRVFDQANTTILSQTTSWKITNPQINTSDNRLKKDQDGDSVADYDYDKAGNLVLDAENKRFVFDADNRMKEFFHSTNATNTPDAVYQYDGEGRRVKKITGNRQTIFVYNSSGALVAEYDSQPAQNPQINFLTTDHLGSPRVITDGRGAVVARHDYMAYGADITETLGNTSGRTTAQGYNSADQVRQQYAGYERDDESNLEYAQARYYNPAHGRFTSVDPLTASATIRNPQTFNRYAYVLNSPYKFTDPLGLIPVSDSAQTAAADTRRCNTGRCQGSTAPSSTTLIPVRNEGAGARANSNRSNHHNNHESNADLTDAEIRAQYPTFNEADQAIVNQAVNDARDVVDPRGFTNLTPTLLTKEFRRPGDSSTPREAMDAVDATSGNNVERNGEGEITKVFNQNVFDGRTSTYLVDDDSNKQTPMITVSEFFEKNSNVNAITVKGFIFLGEGFFKQDAAGRTKSMLHEGVVHRGFGRQDTEFGATRSIGSGAINSKIDSAYKYYRQPASRIIDH